MGDPAGRPVPAGHAAAPPPARPPADRATVAAAVALLLSLLTLPAWAAPDDDIISARARQVILDEGLDAFASLGPESRWRLAYTLDRCAPLDVATKTKANPVRGARAATAAQLGLTTPNAAPDIAAPTPRPLPAVLTDGISVECRRDPTRWTPLYTARPELSLALGTATPDNHAGDTEAGLFSVRAGGRAAIYAGPFVIRTRALAGLNAVPDVSPDYSVPELWAGADTGTAWIGVGRQDRWMGPGQHGTLALSNNAVAPWMVNGGLDGHFPGAASKIGRLRAEVGVGVLAEERTDVGDPGLLLMDFRYLPIPEFEIGLTRESIFGGEGRPDVDVGQLLVPSEPHVYDDPDLTLPDQNELAALNVRVNLPLRKHWNLPIDHVSGWWEYGGEDMIVREVAGVPYPALAGVANLYGGEIRVKPVTFTAEYAQLTDDYFRWYVGHRVYHEGFQQDGRVLGHFGGSDSETAWAQVAVDLPNARLRAWADRTRRVFVIEARGDKVFALPTEEVRVRGGISADVQWKGAWFSAGYSAASTTGLNFVAGSDVLEHRVTIGLSAGPELLPQRK